MNRVKEILGEILELEVQEGVSMLNCEEWDSVNHVYLVLELQDQFGIKISEENIDKIKSYSAIVDYLLAEHGIEI